jgi:serine/threonine protein kinase
VAEGTVAALKVPRLVDVDHIERVEQEAGMLRSLAHPNIVRLLESGPTEDGGIYLAMEFIDGATLANVLPANGFDPARAFDLFNQIAGAMVHAHERGVLHRDLKPGNILIDTEGSAHISDFGLARPVHERVQHLSLTQTGLVAGTFEYLPPEAYHANYTPNAKGDVYALGVILYELLAGSPPRGAWRAVSEQKRIDIRVDEVLRRALTPDPAARWQSVASMCSALAEIHNTPPRYSGTPLVTRGVRAADFAWTVLGILVLIAAIGVEMKIGLVRVPWPVDLVGPHGRLTGGAQALWWLGLTQMPVALWQLLR